LSICGPTVRQIVADQGRAVLAAQQSGSVAPGFTAADCTAETMVTEQQKRKRRATESAKRAREGRASTAKAGRPKTGSDGPYKEFEIVSFYDPDKSHCHVVGTSGSRALW
jgi:hypothetical protein